MHNLMHGGILLGGMGFLLGLLGYILAGTSGVLAAMGGGVLMVTMMRQASPKLLLSAMGAYHLHPDEIPQLHQILGELCRRAGVEAVPKLYVVEGGMMHGFSVGNREQDTAIVLTDALLRGLSLKEIAGVLAHEVGHIRAGDLSVMGLADVISRLTRLLAFFGLFLLAFSWPQLTSGEIPVPWGGIVLLLSAPIVSTLMQLALSRTREFDADQAAVELTGDAHALASALYKLELQQLSLWKSLLPGTRPEDAPSLLRSHPDTEERVEHLQKVASLGVPLPEEMIDDVHRFPEDMSQTQGLPIRWLLRWWR